MTTTIASLLRAAAALAVGPLFAASLAGCPTSVSLGDNDGGSDGGACRAICPTGYTVDSQCHCAPPGDGGGTLADGACNAICPTGYGVDSQCHCVPPQDAGDVDGGECRAICPTGYTVGPQCQCVPPTDGGCVDNIDCRVGTHWDRAACTCVPDSDGGAACPATEPANGTPCAPDGLGCSYGHNTTGCDSDSAQCVGGHWNVVGTPACADGGVACGTTTCGSGQLCVKTVTVGGGFRSPPDDAGTCPAGEMALPCASPGGVCCEPVSYHCAQEPLACTTQAAITCGCAGSLCGSSTDHICTGTNGSSEVDCQFNAP